MSRRRKFVALSSRSTAAITESNLQQALLRLLADDLKPVDEKGRWKPSPLLILVAVLLSALIGVFFYFTFGAHS